jgi:hypothetical protein
VRILIPVSVLSLVVPLSLTAFREGPLPNMTGGFGEPTCRSCHFDNDLNAPGGRLTLTGVPPTYTPGRGYAITVTLTRKDLTRGGFELGARFASGTERGRQAGMWRIEGSRLQTVASKTDSGLVFVQHTKEGTVAAPPGSITWMMEWVAPDETVPVQFNVAANATNDDNSPLGDFIYLAEAVAKPRH